MAKVVEEQLKKCRRCKKQTKHYRNSSKSGFVMILVHLVLIVVTWGVWLAVLIIWSILNAKIGGWKCSECGK